MTKAADNETFVKEFQRRHGLVADGWAGRLTWGKLGSDEKQTSSLSISKRGLDLIKRSEGLELKAYPDPGSGGDPWTIGYGHTKGVKRGQVITPDQADAFLLEDVAEFERAVRRLAPKTTKGQFDALVSFAFNVGSANLEKSTLLKKHNAGDYAGAKAEFDKWKFASGKVLKGLVTRRAAEAELYGS